MHAMNTSDPGNAKQPPAECEACDTPATLCHHEGWGGALCTTCAAARCTTCGEEDPGHLLHGVCRPCRGVTPLDPLLALLNDDSTSDDW